MKVKTIQIDFDDEDLLVLKWRENRAIHGDNIQLVVSHNTYSLGWWIEPVGTTAKDKMDLVYSAKVADSYVDGIADRLEEKQ